MEIPKKRKERDDDISALSKPPRPRRVGKKEAMLREIQRLRSQLDTSLGLLKVA